MSKSVFLFHFIVALLLSCMKCLVYCIIELVLRNSFVLIMHSMLLFLKPQKECSSVLLVGSTDCNWQRKNIMKDPQSLSVFNSM